MKVKVSFNHSYKLSKEGYIHFPIIAFSIGGNGFAIRLFGIGMTVAYIKGNGKRQKAKRSL